MLVIRDVRLLIDFKSGTAMYRRLKKRSWELFDSSS